MLTTSFLTLAHFCAALFHALALPPDLLTRFPVGELLNVIAYGSLY